MISAACYIIHAFAIQYIHSSEYWKCCCSSHVTCCPMHARSLCFCVWLCSTRAHAQRSREAPSSMTGTTAYHTLHISYPSTWAAVGRMQQQCLSYPGSPSEGSRSTYSPFFTCGPLLVRLQSIGWLVSVPGSSNTVIEASVLQSRESSVQALGKVRKKLAQLCHWQACALL
jgi:hypothetical protein